MSGDYKFDNLEKLGKRLWHNCGIYELKAQPLGLTAGRIVFFGNLYDGMPALMGKGTYYVLEEPAVTHPGGQNDMEVKWGEYIEAWYVAKIVDGVLTKHPNAVIRGMGPHY